jgi:uncharacterized protein (DUF169 family)
MGNWAEITSDLQQTLRLKTHPIAYKKLESADDLKQIADVFHPGWTFTYCQVPFMVRVLGLTVGITRDDSMLDRCMRLHGLKDADPESMQREAAMLSTTWLPSPEEAMKQQNDYPRIPAGEAIVAAPLAAEKFEPEVVSIYGNPAQLMMILCGLQKEKYERFHFSFIGEGACADSLAQCYTSGKPALALPCYGERAFGQVSDDEIVVALPPAELAKSLSGLEKLARVGLKYPIAHIGGMSDVAPILAQIYTDKGNR